MGGGDTVETDAKEEKKASWQAVLGGEPCPPQAAVTLPFVFVLIFST